MAIAETTSIKHQNYSNFIFQIKSLCFDVNIVNK